MIIAIRIRMRRRGYDHRDDKIDILVIVMINDDLDEVGRVKNWFREESKVCEPKVESKVG